MSHTHHALPGHFPLAAGKSVSLEPRSCGRLRVATGALALDGRPLAAGDKLTLWRGDRAQLTNQQAAATAHYSWDVCAEQPTVFARVGRALRRAGKWR